MANPGELLRLAAQNKKRMPAERRPANRQDEPAPAQHDCAPVLQIVPRLAGGHSAYSALMRSHDRVHPRIGS